MINYDAALTAVSAIQDATGGSVGMPSPSDIAQYWPTLKGSRTVQGATGLICLDNLGNPYDKAIPVVQYSTTGVPQAGRPDLPGRPAGRHQLPDRAGRLAPGRAQASPATSSTSKASVLAR